MKEVYVEALLLGHHREYMTLLREGEVLSSCKENTVAVIT
jgi:hypothetical protein